MSDIEGWAKQQKNKASRSGAIRRLLEFALAIKSQKAKHHRQISLDLNNPTSGVLLGAVGGLVASLAGSFHGNIFHILFLENG